MIINRWSESIANLLQLKMQLSDELDQITDDIRSNYKSHFQETPDDEKLFQALNFNT